VAELLSVLVQKAFVSVMMAEELGIPPGAEEESPAVHAIVTFVAFTVFGLVPLLACTHCRGAACTESGSCRCLGCSHQLGREIQCKERGVLPEVLVDCPQPAYALSSRSIGVTAVTLVGMGLVKARVTKTSWWKSILMTLVPATSILVLR
jgi:hypothetical protein